MHNMSKNKIFIKFTEITASIIFNLGLNKYLRSENDLRVVNYHGIGDGKAPCFRKLTDEIPLDIFEKHINYLCKNYEILSLSAAINQIKSKNVSTKKPICCITFDDGLRSVYTKAYPLLKKKKIPATIFLNTNAIDNHKITWLHLLNCLLTKYGCEVLSNTINKIIKKKNLNIPCSPADEREIKYWYQDNFERNFIANLLNEVVNEFGMSVDDIAQIEKIYLNWDQIQEMDQYDISYASHTANHTPLGSFSKEYYIKNEIEKARQTICNFNDDRGDFVSFPFGMKSDYGEKAIKYAFDAGHKFILEIGNGLNPSSKILNERIISRVGLGNVSPRKSELYAAIELRPILKHKIKNRKNTI